MVTLMLALTLLVCFSFSYDFRGQQYLAVHHNLSLPIKTQFTFTDCLFSDLHVSESAGGAICIINSLAKLVIRGIYFNNCSSIVVDVTDSGTVNFNRVIGHGGSLYFLGESVSIFRCCGVNSRATLFGQLYYLVNQKNGGKTQEVNETTAYRCGSGHVGTILFQNGRQIVRSVNSSHNSLKRVGTSAACGSGFYFSYAEVVDMSFGSIYCSLGENIIENYLSDIFSGKDNSIVHHKCRYVNIVNGTYGQYGMIRFNCFWDLENVVIFNNKVEKSEDAMFIYTTRVDDQDKVDHPYLLMKDSLIIDESTNTFEFYSTFKYVRFENISTSDKNTHALPFLQTYVCVADNPLTPTSSMIFTGIGKGTHIRKDILGLFFFIYCMFD